MSDHEKAQRMYAESSENVRGRFGNEREAAEAYYRRYVDFILMNSKPGAARFLDVGCGNGWSTWLLRKNGVDAHGCDLHTDALEARSADPELPYTSGDVQKLPFESEKFDGVGLHAVLEHVPEPERALQECLRVLKPGGRLFIVGPNLLSAPLNAYWAIRHTLRCLRSGKIWEKRVPGMPLHPGGNTMPEAWKFTAHHAWHTFQKVLFEKRVRFLKRNPDTRPPFHADNDSSYYCNPMDLVNWARERGDVRVIRTWAQDQLGSRYLWPFRGGTWVVLEKKP